jgi:hypothetical protein
MIRTRLRLDSCQEDRFSSLGQSKEECNPSSLNIQDRNRRDDSQVMEGHNRGR